MCIRDRLATNEKPLMTCSDCEVNKNIYLFGTCKCGNIYSEKLPHPVSYTHLDVYKRQVGILCSITQLDFYQIPGHSIITDKWMITIALIVKVKGSAFLSAVSVSYTHLDVYKRQERCYS